MGWCDESGDHEGWVQPIFNDGEPGTGTSNGEGYIFDEVWENGRCLPKRVRPYSEIVGWRAACECGWHGPTMPLAEISNVDPRWNEGDEDQFHDQWRAHVAPFDAVHRLANLADEARAINDQIDEAVALARQAGASWSQIGYELGITKQAAQQRYGC